MFITLIRTCTEQNRTEPNRIIKKLISLYGDLVRIELLCRFLFFLHSSPFRIEVLIKLMFAHRLLSIKLISELLFFLLSPLYLFSRFPFTSSTSGIFIDWLLCAISNLYCMFGNSHYHVLAPARPFAIRIHAAKRRHWWWVWYSLRALIVDWIPNDR